MTFDWTEGPEPVAFQVVGVCADHGHFELLGLDGSAVAGGILSRQECLTLANLFTRTVEAIDSAEEEYIHDGIARLEALHG
jgi:hypothetical protein